MNREAAQRDRTREKGCEVVWKEHRAKKCVGKRFWGLVSRIKRKVNFQEKCVRNIEIILQFSIRRMLSTLLYRELQETKLFFHAWEVK